MTAKWDRPLLPNSVEDMVEGVVYKDKWNASKILYYCDGCGKKLRERLVHGEPENRFCPTCSNRNPEKRKIISGKLTGIKRDEAFRKQKSEDTKRYLAEHGYSEEKRVIQSRKMKEHWENPQWRVETSAKIKIGQNNMLPEVKKIKAEKCGAKNKQLWENPEYRETMTAKFKEVDNTEEVKAKNRERWDDPEYVKLYSNMLKDRWADPIRKSDMVDAMFKGLQLKPTKPEAYLDTLLQTYFPDQWIYNGDNSCHFKIDGKVPDFLSLDNLPKVIELMSYHHCPALNKNIGKFAIVKNRVELFKKFGYDTLIIWQPELEDSDLVIKKIEYFMKVS